MPSRASDWHSKAFQDSAFWRRQAVQWERLAEMAMADGDVNHAQLHRREAANCRENARQWDISNDQ